MTASRSAFNAFRNPLATGVFRNPNLVAGTQSALGRVAFNTHPYGCKCEGCSKVDMERRGNLRNFSSSSTFQRRGFATTRWFQETHEYIDVEDDNVTATIGVSDFAQKELGEIVYVDLPEVGFEVQPKDSMVAIECGDGKAVGEVYLLTM